MEKNVLFTNLQLTMTIVVKREAMNQSYTNVCIRLGAINTSMNGKMGTSFPKKQI